MHLVYKALENIPVPSVLPPELASILKRKHSIAGIAPVLPDVLPQGIDNPVVSSRIRRSSTPSSDVRFTCMELSYIKCKIFVFLHYECACKMYLSCRLLVEDLHGL